MISTITKYTSTDEKDAERRTKLCEVKKEKIIDIFIGKYELFILAEGITSTNRARYWEMVSILLIIGINYVLWFQKIITPPQKRGREATPSDIPLQIVVVAFVVALVFDAVVFVESNTTSN